MYLTDKVPPRDGFALNPYVMHVKGAKRAALYDLHRKRIFPIPGSASLVLDLCEELGGVELVLDRIDCPENRAIAESYLREFERMDFGRFRREQGIVGVPFRSEEPAYRTGRLQWLSLDWRASDAATSDIGPEAWNEIVSMARKVGPAHQLTVFIGKSGVNPPWVMDSLNHFLSLQFHHIEVVLPEGGTDDVLERFCADAGIRVSVVEAESGESATATIERLWALGLRPRRSRASDIARITERALQCDHQSFARLRWSSVHAGSLHIRNDGTVFPWAGEEFHQIGQIRSGSEFLELMKSDKLRRVWGHNKDAIATCRDCEFRYACPSSYSFRANPQDISSAPTNCSYDPYEGVWEYRTGAGVFGGDTQSDVVSSSYFEIHSTPARPFPDEYMAVLDQSVVDICATLEISTPSGPIEYFYYPSLDSIQADLAHHGAAMAGLTEVRPEVERTVVRSSYPCHIHEVAHALFYSMNRAPRFFVSEACATMFGRARGADGGLCSSVSLSGAVSYEIRLDGQSSLLRLDEVLAFDQAGLLLGAEGVRSIHDVARWLLNKQGVPARIDEYFDAEDERDLPGHFYELGGSFFMWLLETKGPALFKAFYRSGQNRNHVSAFFGAPLVSLVEQWHCFITKSGRSS